MSIRSTAPSKNLKENDDLESNSSKKHHPIRRKNTKNDNALFTKILCYVILVPIMLVMLIISFTLFIVRDGSKSNGYPETSTPKPIIPTKPGPPIALRWYAPFLSGGGYCSEAIAIALGLNTRISQITSFRKNPENDAQSKNVKHPSAWPWSDSYLPYPIILRDGMYLQLVHHVNLEPGIFPLYTKQNPVHPLESMPIKIGRTMFETDRIPGGWPARCNQFDEIWVPSKFHVDTFAKAGVTKDKIVVIPEPVDVSFFDPDTVARVEKTKFYDYFLSSECKEQISQVSDNEFRFLSIFKWEKRKGWNFLLKAFFEEFSADENVVLYMLSNPFYSAPQDVTDQINRITSEIKASGKATLPRVCTIQTGLPTTSMPALYKSMNAFVLPSRGEGWGRPHMEAMAMGLPVIATNWSGNLEFMNEENSYLIEIEELETITDPGIAQGHKWAKPSEKHLRQLMRKVYSNYDAAKLKAKKAKQEMRDKYSPTAVADIILQRLDLIAADLPKTNQRDVYHDHERDERDGDDDTEDEDKDKDSDGDKDNK